MRAQAHELALRLWQLIDALVRRAATPDAPFEASELGKARARTLFLRPCYCL
jgi:hypothetical protein